MSWAGVSWAASGSGNSPSQVAVPARVMAYQPLRGAVPADTVFTNVDYNGGPVMPGNTDYLVFWSPTGYGAYGSGSPPEYVSGLKQYFTDLAHDSGGDQNTDSVSAQYNALTGAMAKYHVTFGGVVLDKDPYPASKCPVNSPVTECLTDPQIQAELEKIVSTHKLKTDLTHEYFLLTPPHVEGCFSSDASANPAYGGCSAGEVPSSLGVYCAYHQNTTVSPMLLYSDDPYVTGNPGCDDGNHPNGPSDGALEGGLSHEHNESITDPVPNDAWTNGAGSNQGYEIGDQCDGQMGSSLGVAPDGAKYNQVINGHFYWYQEEWSNQGHACLQRLTPATTVPVAKFTVKAGSGLAMTFDASASTAPGGVADYSWQFNDAYGASTVEQTSPIITHTFPSAGSYSIGLTVYASTGLSRGAGGIVTTGHNGFTRGFTFSPAAPAAGQTVSFAGLTNVSAQPVASYLWEFGDGTTASGPNPTHVYAASGTYLVQVVLFSGVGSAYPGAGAGPIFAEKITVS
ncbi:MAG: PKD domain-containing protein [Acidimicrobiales bacterium]